LTKKLTTGPINNPLPHVPSGLSVREIVIGSSIVTKAPLFATLTLAIAVASGCGDSGRVNIADEEAAIRKTDADWLAAAQSRDLKRVLPFWSDDATILAPDGPPIKGKDAIRKYVSDAFATPGFSITWKTQKIEVSQSGDMAYSTGTDEISVNGTDGKSITQINRSVAVWMKQADGSWKCVVDSMTPAQPSSAK
jgi:uncharacterized protein (TIGR02246 family)